MKISARLTDFGFWLGWNVLWLLPEVISSKFFDLGARVAWLQHGTGVKQLELNLSRVTGQDPASTAIRNLSKKAMRSYMRYYCETFLLPRWSDKEVVSRVRANNIEPLLAALKTGGLILTLPHSGNWDHAGAWAAKTFGSLCTVAERLRPEGVFQKFLKMRLAHGLTLMPLTGAGGTYEYLKDNLQNGKVIALLGDRDVAGNGMTNEFFGVRTTLPIGAAVLAIDTGRPLFTCSTWYDGKALVIDFDEEVKFERNVVTGRDRLKKAQEVSAIVAKRFEQHISKHPENWHQLQPIWNDLKLSQVGQS